MNWYSSLL